MRSKYSDKSTYLRATLVLVSIIFLVLATFPGRLPAAEPLPDTGQTKCFNEAGAEINPCPAPGEAFHGQDAQYNASERQHSYTKLDASGNALLVSATIWYQVKDNVTGLIWEVKTDDGIHDRDNNYTWSNAQSVFIAELNSDSGYCGHSDWRLPTIKELSGIVDSGCDAHPYINTTYFSQTLSSSYWSSTTDASGTSYAWLVGFYNGDVYGHYKSSSYYVRAVRSGQ